MIPVLSPLSRIMTGPLIVTPPYSVIIFTVKTVANCPETAKFGKVFTRERFPLHVYGKYQKVRMDPGRDPTAGFFQGSLLAVLLTSGALSNQYHCML